MADDQDGDRKQTVYFLPYPHRIYTNQIWDEENQEYFPAQVVIVRPSPMQVTIPQTPQYEGPLTVTPQPVSVLLRRSPQDTGAEGQPTPFVLQFQPGNYIYWAIPLPGQVVPRQLEPIRRLSQYQRTELDRGENDPDPHYDGVIDTLDGSVGYWYVVQFPTVGVPPTVVFVPWTRQYPGPHVARSERGLLYNFWPPAHNQLVPEQYRRQAALPFFARTQGPVGPPPPLPPITSQHRYRTHGGLYWPQELKQRLRDMGRFDWREDGHGKSEGYYHQVHFAPIPIKYRKPLTISESNVFPPQVVVSQTPSTEIFVPYKSKFMFNNLPVPPQYPGPIKIVPESATGVIRCDPDLPVEEGEHITHLSYAPEPYRYWPPPRSCIPIKDSQVRQKARFIADPRTRTERAVVPFPPPPEPPLNERLQTLVPKYGRAKKIRDYSLTKRRTSRKKKKRPMRKLYLEPRLLEDIEDHPSPFEPQYPIANMGPRSSFRDRIVRLRPEDRYTQRFLENPQDFVVMDARAAAEWAAAGAGDEDAFWEQVEAVGGQAGPQPPNEQEQLLGAVGGEPWQGPLRSLGADTEGRWSDSDSDSDSDSEDVFWGQLEEGAFGSQAGPEPPQEEEQLLGAVGGQPWQGPQGGDTDNEAE